MAFATTGAFSTPKTTEQPIDSLLAAAKKKTKTGVVTQPANVFAPAAAAKPTGTFGTTEAAPVEEVQPAPPDTVAASSMPEPPAGITPEVRYISDDPESPYYWETLGYSDESWVGLPLEMGWYTTNEAGEEVWVQQRDMRSVAQQLHDLQNIPVPERPELIDLTSTEAYGGIQDLINLWNDPNRTQEDKEAAIAQFEREMGQEPGWFAQQMAAMYGDLSGGIMARPGLSGEYTDAYNRETQLELQNMRGEYTRMLEAMSAGGRNVAGYQKMDEIVNSLASFETKRDVERLNLDLAMKQAEYDALNERWQGLYNMGQMSAQQYIDNVNQNRTNALTGYAQQLSTVISQNQLTLEAYKADLLAVQTHAEIVYKGILADMQVSESMMNEMQSRYEMYMAPYYAELDAWAIQEQARQQGQANTMAAAGLFVQGVATMALCIATSAICIEMNRRGYFPREWLDIDHKFGLLVRKRRPDVYSGYARLCNWVIPLMRRSNTFVKIVNFFFQPWIKDMAYLMGRSKKRNWFGRFINVFGFWLCKMTGKKPGGGYYGYLG